MAKGLNESDIRIDVEISPDLQRLMDHSAEIVPQAIKLGLRKITKQGSKKAKQRVQSLGLVKTGAYRKSITGRTSNAKSFIGTKLWRAHFLEGGTKPHVIKAKRGKMLWFPGIKRPVKKVNHPGIKAYKPIENTVDDMQVSGEINSLFSQGVQEALKELS